MKSQTKDSFQKINVQIGLGAVNSRAFDTKLYNNIGLVETKTILLRYIKLAFVGIQ